MENDLILLLGSTVLKICALITLGFFLLNKWKKQSKRYFTDFPFLMSLTFFIYALGKIYDLILYYIYRNTPVMADLYELGDFVVLIVKMRFILSPVVVIFPFLILMMIIWFGEKKKLQIFLSSTWFLLSIISILVARTYSQLLLINAIVAFPTILLSIISFFILNKQERLPEINSLILAFGWIAYVGVQLIRPVWSTLGTGNWGLTWLGELVEMATLIIVGIGFMIPARYGRSMKEDSPKKIKSKEKGKVIG